MACLSACSKEEQKVLAQKEQPSSVIQEEIQEEIQEKISEETTEEISEEAEEKNGMVNETEELDVITLEEFQAYVEELAKKVEEQDAASRNESQSSGFDRRKAEEALDIIDEIFHNEKTYKEQKLEPYLIEAKREIELRPLLDKLKSWVKRARYSKDFFAESNIGKAVTYTLERINGLYEVIKNGLLDVSNNMAERTMRGHAMGRLCCAAHNLPYVGKSFMLAS